MRYLFLSLIFSQISYCQISKFTYSSIIEKVRDKKEIAHYVDIPNTFKKREIIVVIDDNKKTITVSRKFITKNGEQIDEFENYSFVKKEKIDENSYQYFAVDLANKQYVEFLIGIENAFILRECDGFYGCQKSNQLTK